MRFRCPRCGDTAELRTKAYLVYPPQVEFKCPECGYIASDVSGFTTKGDRE